MKRASFVVVAIIALALVAGTKKSPSDLRLVSPNGKHSISLTATDDGAGIYVWDNSAQKPKGISIYFTQKQTAIAIYDNHDMPGLAVSSSDKSGYLQIADKTGKIRIFEADGKELRAGK